MLVLITLPVELLYEIQLFAMSPALPQTCKMLHQIFSVSSLSFRAQYLVACTRTGASHAREDLFLTKILRYPICTKNVLDACLRLQSRTLDSRREMQLAPELPRRLFRALVRASGSAPWSERDPPLPFLHHLYTHSGLPPPNPNSHDGYALTKAVQAGFVPLVRFLLDHGATPACKGNLAVIIAIHRKDLGLVKMLIERREPKTNNNTNGKRRKFEDRVNITPEMLRAAVKCRAQDIIEYLTREKGCIPDIQTLLLMR